MFAVFLIQPSFKNTGLCKLKSRGVQQLLAGFGDLRLLSASIKDKNCSLLFPSACSTNMSVEDRADRSPLLMQPSVNGNSLMSVCSWCETAKAERPRETEGDSWTALVKPRRQKRRTPPFSLSMKLHSEESG